MQDFQLHTFKLQLDKYFDVEIINMVNFLLNIIQKLIVATEIKEGAQFIVAGDDLAFAFINCDPTNSPNRKVGSPLKSLMQ